MAKNTTNIDKLLSGERDRKGNHSFYVSNKVYKDFIDRCQKLEVVASQVVEAMLKDFLERTNVRKGRK